MKLSLRLFTLLSLSFAATAPAQDVRLFGRVQSAGTRFVVECTVIELRADSASRIDLDAFRGQVCDVGGTNVGTAAAPIVNVRSIARAADVFQLRGDGRIGGKFELQVEGTGRFAIAYGALGPGFLPLEPFARFLHGTFLLDPRTFFYLSSGSLQQVYRVDYPIPNVRALIGLEFFSQAAILKTDGSLVYIGSGCMRISDA